MNKLKVIVLASLDFGQDIGPDHWVMLIDFSICKSPFYSDKENKLVLFMIVEVRCMANRFYVKNLKCCS